MSCPALWGASSPRGGEQDANPRWRQSGTAARAEGEAACGLHGHAAPVCSARRTVQPPAPSVSIRVGAAGCRRSTPSGRASCHRGAVGESDVDFGWRRVGDLHRSQDSVGEVGGPGRVARAAADDQPAIGAAALGDFLDVVGGQVGGGVGGSAFPSWAPVADDGAVVGDDAASPFPLSGVVVEVVATVPLGLVLAALAVVAAGFAAYCLAASDAGAEQAAAHRGLRRRRSASCSRWRGQRSPGPTNLAWQMRQRPCGWPRNREGRPLPTAPEGEEDRGGRRDASTYADHPGPAVGRDPDHGDVVEGSPGPGDPLPVSGPATPAGDLGEPYGQAEGYPSRARARTSLPIRVSETCQAPWAASARSSNSTITPMGRVPASLGWVAVSGTRAGLVPARAPPSKVSVTSRPRSTTLASTPQGRRAPTRVRPSPSSRRARELVRLRVWIMRQPPSRVVPGCRCLGWGAGPLARGLRCGVSSRPGSRSHAPGSG